MEPLHEQVRRSFDLFNAGAFDELTATYSDDAVRTTPMGAARGRDAIGAGFRSQRNGFPDERITLHRVLVCGDTAVAEYEWEGTHTGPLPTPDGPDLPPTGAYAKVPAVSVFEFKGGMTREHRMYCDQLPLMIQLGVMAPPG